MSPVSHLNFIIESIPDVSQQDLAGPFFYWIGSKQQQHSWIFTMLSFIFCIVIVKLALIAVSTTIRYSVKVFKRRTRRQVAFSHLDSVKGNHERNESLTKLCAENEKTRALNHIEDCKYQENVPQEICCKSNKGKNKDFSSDWTLPKEKGAAVVGHSHKIHSKDSHEKPSFIKGDINIDPEKCQGFFSRGSITFEASTVAGEPSRVSIEYDEEMSKYLRKIIRKKSRSNSRFIYMCSPVIITEENIGWFAVGVCLSLCAVSITLCRRNQ